MSRKTYQNWVFTWNNPDVAADAVWPLFEEKSATWVFFQEEQGESGTRHYQGTCSFSSRKSLQQVKTINGAIHFEPRRGSLEQSIDYCSKEETRVSGPYEFGSRPAGSRQGERSDLVAMAATVRESGLAGLAVTNPEAIVRYGRGLQLYASQLPIEQSGRSREVILLFGPPGCGKTRTYFDREGSSAPLLDSTCGFWFDGYLGQDSVLLDDFDGSRSQWKLSQVLNCLDRYNRKVPIKGGFVNWAPQRIYVSTNYHPIDWYDFGFRALQWPALKRRFTCVIWWRTVASLPRILPGPGQPDHVALEWDHFWSGIAGLQKELDVASGKLISRAPTMDYYDF